MTPQRPRPPQPGRTSGPARPVAPTPAPDRASGSGGTGRTAGGGAQQETATAATSSRPVPATEPAPGTADRAAVPDAAAARPPVAPGGRRSSGSALTVPRTAGFPVRPPVVSQGSAARFAERARARQRLAWRQILLAAGGAVALGTVAWLLLFSPVLALEADQVQVTGAGTVVAVDQVRAVVNEAEGTPLTRLDTAGLRADLLNVPGVRDVTVSRNWPHGLTVALVSREPVAAVPESADVVAAAPGDEGGADGGGYALVDRDGVKVGRADAPPEGLPVVEVPVGEARILSAVLGVLHSLPEVLLADVAKVSAATQDTVEFVLRDGATVEWGSAQDAALKVAVLQALRAAPETAGSSRYDVSAPTMPVVG